jgi:hypothetical protein
MLKTSAGLAWTVAALVEWLKALGSGAQFPRWFEAALWTVVLGMHLKEMVQPAVPSDRTLAGMSGGVLLLFGWGIKMEELWYDIPLAFQVSRRAEILSFEWWGIPWFLLLVPLTLVPSAFLLDKWLRGDLAAGFLRTAAARLTAIGYFGVTLLACLRYGAGELVS